MIICNNDYNRAAELIKLNGYADSPEKAKGIIDRENGKS
jgi:hypothetical protein